MEDLVKKIVYTSVGFVNGTTEIVQKAVGDIVSQGKVSEDEGKKIVDNLMTDTNSKKEELESKLKTMVENAIARVKLPTKTNFEELTKRVETLEAKVAKKRTPRSKATTKKTATTKDTKETTK